MTKPLRLLLIKDGTAMDIIEYHAQGITRAPFLKKIRIRSNFWEYQGSQHISASPYIFNDPSAIAKYYGWPEYAKPPVFVYWQKK